MIAAGLAAAVLVASGCGGGDDSTSSRGDDPQYPTADLALFDKSTDRLLDGALSVLVSRCMADKGFEFLPTDPDQTQRSQDAAAPSTYVFQEIPTAARQANGYYLWQTHDDVAEPTIDTETRQRDIYSRLSPAEQQRFDTALEGEPDQDGAHPVFGGCYGMAVRQVFPDAQAWQDANQKVRNLEAEVNHRMRTNRHLLALELKWASCMHDAGFPVNSQSDAYDLALQVYGQSTTLASADLAPLKKKEVEIAVADTDCSQSVGLGREAAAVHDEVVAAVVADNETTILAFKEMLSSGLERARAAIANGGG